MAREFWRTLKWGSIILGMAGFVRFVLIEGPTAWTNIKEIRAEWRDDAAYQGTWNSDGEGFVDGEEWASKTPEELVWLSIEVKDGDISGMIHSPRLCSYLPWNYVQLRGDNTWWGTTAAAQEQVGGITRQIASFKVAFDSEATGLLILTPNTPTLVFPGKVRLAKVADTVADGLQDVPPTCEVFGRLIKSRRTKLNPTGK